MKSKLRKQQARRAQFEVQKGVCCICKDPEQLMTLDDPAALTYATFEHVVPKSRGGRGVPKGTLPLAHQECNHRLGDGTLTIRALQFADEVNAKRPGTITLRPVNSLRNLE